MEQALRAGYTVLKENGTALDAVEAAVRVLEDNPLFNAGRGASLGWNGDAELDASLMDSAGRAGAIAGVRTVRNPVTLARAVMERSPYVFLVGPGAEEFAQSVAEDANIELVTNDYFMTPGRQAQWKALRARGGNFGTMNTAALPVDIDLPDPAQPADGKMGTVGAVARDVNGNLAAATSTGGMAVKRYGRIGDSPVIGAGTWADTRCAISATGHGEFFIRGAVAHDIAARVAYGNAPLPDAARVVVLEHLAAQNADGGLIALGVDGVCVLPFNTPAMYRGCIAADGTVFTAIF